MSHLNISPWDGQDGAGAPRGCTDSTHRLSILIWLYRNDRMIGQKRDKMLLPVVFKYKFRRCKKIQPSWTGGCWALSGSSVPERNSVNGRDLTSVKRQLFRKLFLPSSFTGSMAYQPRPVAEYLTEAGSHGVACRAMRSLGWGDF